MEFPFPEYIQLYPTTRCNQHCSFCFNPEDRKTNDLDFDNALVLLDILDRDGIRGIDIMGGEPFLLPWLIDFVKIAISRGFSINISTNGSNPEVLHKFAGRSPDDLNIGISLEGSTAEIHNRLTGSLNFEYAFKSIKKLVGLSLNPIVKTVLSPDNTGDIQNIVELIREIGVNRYFIIHMDILRKEDIAIKKVIGYTAFLGFYHKMQKENPDISVQRVNASCFDRNSLPPGIRCAGGVRKLSIMPDGSVFPCNLFHGLKGFGLGNIFKDSLKDIWANQRLDYFRRHQENTCTIYSCSNHASCTGGCPAHGYYHYGKYEGADVRCFQAKN